MNEELRTPSVGRMPQGTADFDLDMLDKAAWGSKEFAVAVDFKTKNPFLYHVVKRKADQMEAYPVMVANKIYEQILDLVRKELSVFKYDMVGVGVEGVVEELLNL